MQENPYAIAFPDLISAGRALCDIFFEEMEKALATKGNFRVILAGGTTPREAYREAAARIIAARLPMERFRWFFGDERWVPSDHPRSNEAMARETLLGPTHAPEDTVFSWNAGFGNPVECARRYGETVKKIMGGADDPPNLLLLGLGEDGHTASLFPDGVVHHLNGGESMVGRDLAGISAAVWVASLREWRMTLCPSFLVTARRIVFLVSGKGKRATLRRALNRDAAVPASWVVGGNTLFLATRDALGENDGD